MIGFEVILRGKKLCTAGIGSKGVLVANLTLTRRSGKATEAPASPGMVEYIVLRVGGLEDERTMDWVTERNTLVVGDEVTIRLVDAEQPISPPIHTEGRSDLEIARRHRYYLYRTYKAEFEPLEATGQQPHDPDPEQARAIRQQLFNEYQKEFAGDE